MVLRSVTVAALAISLGGPLLAQADPNRSAQPERPTVATHAFSVAPGYLEIEVGGEVDRYRGGTRGGVLPVALKFGLMPRLQLTLLGSVASPPGGSSGIGDVSAGLKFRLNDTTSAVGVFALLPSIKVPTGSASRGTGTGTTDFSLLGILSRPLGPVAMDLNAGVTLRSGDGSPAPRRATVWTASFGGSLGAGGGGWTCELYGYPGTSGPSGTNPSVSLLVGPTWALAPSLVLDVGVIAPLQGDVPKAFYAGLVYNLGRLGPSRRGTTGIR